MTHITTIRKSDEDRQIVYGEVYAPNRIDTQGEMMLPEDVELMAHRYMRLKLDQAIDIRHNNIAISAYAVESFIAREGDPDFTEGAWVLGVKIEDEDVWSDIKTGKLNGFSFQAMVKYASADVEIELIRDQVGKTELAEDHEHFYFVQLNENGNVLKGRTSKAEDGHFHLIGRASVTHEASGHSHRFFI